MEFLAALHLASRFCLHFDYPSLVSLELSPLIFDTLGDQITQKTHNYSLLIIYHNSLLKRKSHNLYLHSHSNAYLKQNNNRIRTHYFCGAQLIPKSRILICPRGTKFHCVSTSIDLIRYQFSVVTFPYGRTWARRSLINRLLHCSATTLKREIRIFYNYFAKGWV